MYVHEDLFVYILAYVLV